MKFNLKLDQSFVKMIRGKKESVIECRIPVWAWGRVGGILLIRGPTRLGGLLISGYVSLGELIAVCIVSHEPNNKTPITSPPSTDFNPPSHHGYRNI
jgi:hypothetical protein